MKNNVRSKTTARWSTILVCSGVLALSLLAIQPTQAKASVTGTDATSTTAVAASPQEGSSASQSLEEAPAPEEKSETAQTQASTSVENSSGNETNPATTTATDKYAAQVTTSIDVPSTDIKAPIYSGKDTDPNSPVTYTPSTADSTDTSNTTYDAVITHDVRQYPTSVTYTTATVDADGNVKANAPKTIGETDLQQYIPKDATSATTIVIPDVKTISNDNLTTFLQSIDVPELFTRNSKIPIKHMIQVLDGDFTFSPFKCRKRASALV